MLASDGVWEFLTNQTVTDMILKFDDPLEACHAVVAEAYRLWLQFEVRTDDITMFLAFFDHDEPAPGAALDSELTTNRSEDSPSVSSAALLPEPAIRPVRRGVSKEKRLAMALGASNSASADDEEGFFEPVVVPKTDVELAKIQKAVRANFLFQHLNAAQSQQILDAMVKTEAAAGEVVIAQGTRGDHFYIVDSGEYAVTVAAGESRPPVEVMRYSTSGGLNPCFGELAILHSKPRAATVTCVAPGTLWAIDRRSFRAVLMRSSSQQLTRALRSVGILKSLSVNQIQRLEDVLTEVAYADGDYVVREGDTTDTFYVIVRGTVSGTDT